MAKFISIRALHAYLSQILDSLYSEGEVIISRYRKPFALLRILTPEETKKHAQEMSKKKENAEK